MNIKKAFVKLLVFIAGSEISASFRGTDAYGNAVPMDTGTYFKSGQKRTHTQIVAGPGNEAINQGIAAVGTTQILAATVLTAAAAAVTTFVAQPDVPRTVRLVAAKTGATAVGDNTFDGAANSRVVLVTGTDIHDNVMSESIVVNDTTAVDGKRAFKTITSILMPARVNTDAGDTIAVGFGGILGMEYPVEAVTDILEYGVKAAAATVYTITTLGTMDILTQASRLNEVLSATDVTATVVDGAQFTDSAAAWATGYFAEIIGANGVVNEIVFVWDVSSNDLTLKRGMCGTVAREHGIGSYIVRRPGFTFKPAAITAEDRFMLVYRTKGL